MRSRGAVACLTLIAASVMGEGSPAADGFVRTANGRVAGVRMPTGYVFKGIAYAAAPTGARRWRSPHAPHL